MMRLITTITVFFNLIFICQCGFSQTTNALDAVTVTATLTPQTISKTGRNITVINGDAFKQMPVNSIDELLRYVPGIEVQARGPMGTQSDIVIRGGTFQQVLVILDGIRLNDPLTGHFNSYIPIAVSEIEKIEILKGASSAIYGSEAVGGVINIITKSFSSSKKVKNIEAQFKRGQYGLANFTLGGLWNNEKNTFAGGLNNNFAKGQQQRGITGYFNNTTLSLSYKRIINSNFQVSYRTAYDNRDFAAQNFYTTFKSDTASEKVQSYWNHVKLAYNKQKHRFNFDAGLKVAKDFYLFSSTVSANQNRSSLFQTQIIYETELTKNTTLIAGTQFIQKQIASNDRGNHKVNQIAAYITLNQKLGNFFNISPALRADNNNISGTELIPQINISFKKANYQFRGSLGKTTRDADFTERYNNYGKPLVKSGSLGNADLIPETSFSYEVGADYFFGSFLKISASVFKRDQQNLIDYIPTKYADIPRKDNIIPSGTYALAKNIAKVNTRGLEADFDFKTSFSKDKSLLLTSGILFLKSESSSSTPSFYISSHANFLTNFSIRYLYKAASISFNGLYKLRSQRYAPAIDAAISKDYFVLNSQLAYAIKQNQLKIFIETNNIFDRKYSDILGSMLPGRWILGGIQCNF
ncbi:MAG: TonB-dependent receptor plug domain-containing protein [Ferruginibacter sp.]